MYNIWELFRQILYRGFCNKNIMDMQTGVKTRRSSLCSFKIAKPKCVWKENNIATVLSSESTEIYGVFWHYSIKWKKKGVWTLPIYPVLEGQLSELMRCTTSSTDIKTLTYGKKPCWWIFLQMTNGYLKLESSNNKENKKRGKKRSRKVSELEKVENRWWIRHSQWTQL